MRLNPSIIPLIFLCATTVSYASKEITIKHFFGMMQSMVDDADKLARIMYEDRQGWCTKWVDVPGPFSFDRYKEAVEFLMTSDKTNRTHHPLFLPERLKGTLETYKKKARSGMRAEVKSDAQDSYKLFKFLCESMREDEEPI
ncbi:hypothetical protein PRIPAC_91198 [Pristionchus pacificus]|uniref:Uncharacterized protein n=1 Tax=Pristionchus pacificus TaxID=54126 RepID=A0A454XRG7_PRIPA|nr:hypothetical protein PRIPAC_91198 [Pristionchus pacificus]|eukprot:PDM83338.1 hypothetical protein PRIPAC_34970 [Pristionchus pacificus]